MLIGRVVHQFVATRKHASHQGSKLLLIQPLTPEGRPLGEEVLAIDGANAGIGDIVLLVQEGWSAMHVLGQFFTPVDAAVIGVVDEVRVHDTP